MSSLFNKFKTNKDKDLGGVPVTFDANSDKTIPTFYIRRMGAGNTVYDSELARIVKPYQQQIQKGTLSEQESRNLNDKVFVRGILAGWENVYDENDKPIVFNEANALKLLSDLPLLYEELRSVAGNVSRFQDEVLEETLKN